MLVTEDRGPIFSQILHSKQSHVLNEGNANEVVWGYEGSNRACSSCLHILKDESKPHH